MDKKSKLILLLIFIVLLLIFGGYYLSTYLNKSLTQSSTQSSTQKPTQAPTQAPTLPRQPPGTLGSLCLTAHENETFIANAPEGTHFTKILFADYGQPGCGNFAECSVVFGDSTDDGKKFPFYDKYWGSTEINNTTTRLSTDVNNDTMLLDPCPGKDKWFTAIIEYVWI